MKAGRGLTARGPTGIFDFWHLPSELLLMSLIRNDDLAPLYTDRRVVRTGVTCCSALGRPVADEVTGRCKQVDVLAERGSRRLRTAGESLKTGLVSGSDLLK